MITFTENVTLTRMTCGDCGVVFAIPLEMHDAKIREAGTFFCPNGHERGWQKSEAQKLREVLAVRENELRAAKCYVLRGQQLLDAEKAIREKAEKKLRRVAKGVCPCCKRNFSNLARHMATKHHAKAE